MSAPGATWIVGPGATAGAVAWELGFAPTLRGADVWHPTGEVELDVTEERLFEVAQAASARLVLGVVGGQGFLLGRGNQQLSPRVIDSLGADRVDIVATNEKVAGLFPAELFVDAGLRVAIIALDGLPQFGRADPDLLRQGLDRVGLAQIAGLDERPDIARAGMDQPEPVIGDEAPVADEIGRHA